MSYQKRCGSNEGLGTVLLARLPTMVAAYSRLRQGLEPIAPDAGLGHAANDLQMLTGERPSAAVAPWARNLSLNTVADHGLNASPTFAARVLIIVTGSDMVSAVTGAIGALKGPLHGGAPGPALIWSLRSARRNAPSRTCGRSSNKGTG